MQTKQGVDLIPGKWYNCNKSSYFFRYLRDREPDGILYSEKIISGSYSKQEYYINNKDYLVNITEALFEEIAPFLPYIPDITPTIINSYEIY